MSRDLTPEFWADVAKLLPGSGAVIIDVGAHHLEEAQQLLPLLRDASWHAFEPNPECCSTCYKYIAPALLSRCARLVVNQSAVGAHVGQATLHLSAKRGGEPWTASSSTHPPKNVTKAYPWLCFPDKIQVQVTTLDEYCRQKGIASVDLLKMDAQGAEIDVVRGGQSTLAATKYVITEVVESEEYEGQVGLRGLLGAMPGEWELVEKTISDALLRNKRMT